MAPCVLVRGALCASMCCGREQVGLRRCRGRVRHPKPIRRAVAAHRGHAVETATDKQTHTVVGAKAVVRVEVATVEARAVARAGARA